MAEIPASDVQRLMRDILLDRAESRAYDWILSVPGVAELLEDALMPEIRERWEEEQNPLDREHDEDAPGPEDDAEAFLDYWHDGMPAHHWSSPNGCHKDCPACKEGDGEEEDTHG